MYNHMHTSEKFYPWREISIFPPGPGASIFLALNHYKWYNTNIEEGKKQNKKKQSKEISQHDNKQCFEALNFP